ncbi:LOW QUALITY PROTEIN: Hypothetical protein PHPALM_19574 [Phytophthora palmivora]|uniref:Integrase catalytic domain-containing protein n=1 Tax=Phytophthora palmivora TaxID=4796 RepID=A0A2P4XH51_9STRA|nr:LOW QUALITY PROTEIN: Hypothetical protein PHPALM_19574 [Phytophthora palmivora]
MTGYCELVVCGDPTAQAPCRCLLDWFKRFGPVPQWVSDQGTHYKNQLLEMLQKSYGSAHHFTTAYCPWANGTVEVMNRLLLKCLRDILSELKLHISDWSTVLPLVQSVLNRTPSDRLGGVAAVTAFTALPASLPIHSILHPQTTEVFDVQVVYTKQHEHIAAVQASLEDMRKTLSHQEEQRRAQARDRRAAKRGVDMANYEIGDFVLVAQVIGRANKLVVHWRGPRRVVRTLNDYVFEVQDLSAPFKVSTHHASRFRFYAEAGRDVTEDLVAQAMHGDGGHLVSKLLQRRLEQGSHIWEILVEWVGLDRGVMGTTPIMCEGVPKLVEKFVMDMQIDSAHMPCGQY